MKHKTIILLIVVIFGILYSNKMSFGEDDSLFIDGIYLKLGMPRDTVISSLENRHSLMKIENKDAWLIMNKNKECIGAVSFKYGKLYSINKEWGDDMNSLFSVLDNLNKEGKNEAFIKTETIRLPEATINSIKMQLGNKKIFIIIPERSYPPKGSITISEQISYD